MNGYAKAKNIDPIPSIIVRLLNCIKIKNAINHLGQWKYIDLCSPMLETGYEKFYGEDPLHMNVLGYSLLSKLIRDELSVFNN